MSISNLKKHNAQFEKLDAIANLTNDDGTPTRKKNAPRVTRSMVARSPSPTASSCVSDSTLVSMASTSAIKTPKKLGRRTSKASKKPKDEVSEAIEEANSNSNILPDVQESQVIIEADVASPTSSIVSQASSVRFSTRKTVEKKSVASKLESSDTLDTPTTKKYNLRSKGGSATPQYDESEKKTASKLTRKPRVSRRVSKIAIETSGEVNDEVEEKIESDLSGKTSSN